MDQEQFERRVLEFKIRIQKINGREGTQDLPEKSQDAELMEEAQSMLEELLVAQAELRQQNEELEVTRLQLEVEQARYKELFELAPDGYLVTDHASTIQEANQAAAQMFNVPPKYLVGKPLATFIDHRDLEKFRSFLNTLGARSPILHKDFWIKPRSTEAFPASLTIAPGIQKFGGRQVHFSLRWMIHDNTEYYKFMQALRDANENLEIRVGERTSELARKNQELQDFAFIASHDMQEPLRKVRVFGEMIRDKAGESLGKEGYDYLERMLRANQRMEGMLQGLLNYSRVATRTETFTPTDLNKTLADVITDLELRIEPDMAAIEVQPLLIVDADPNQMRQLFENLLVNALKFHLSGVKPHIKVWCEPGSEGYTQIMVRDDGIGFKEEFAQEIFQPFRRLHSPSQYEGAGMGLAICKKIVERHSGVITAHGKEGSGATFIVQLPIHQSAG